MKNFLKDCLILLLLCIACASLYWLPMQLFSWMYTWPHWVMIVVYVFMYTFILAIFEILSGLTGLIPFKTIVGLVIACVDLLSALAFSVWDVWNRLPHENGWELAIKIFATSCFAYIFIRSMAMIIGGYIDRQREIPKGED